jgi:hypothetical protein
MFWRTGAQLVALNWQRFDLGMQQNEALFRGSGGMVLKPEYVHKGDAPELSLSIRVVSSPAVCSVTVLYLSYRPCPSPASICSPTPPSVFSFCMVSVVSTIAF